MTTITARDFMVNRLTTLTPDTDVGDAIRLLQRHYLSEAPVVDADGRYLGVLSERGCMQAIVDSGGEKLAPTKVGAVMDTDAKTITPQTPVAAIAEAFLHTPYRWLPVLAEDGILLGLVSRRDMVGAVIDTINPKATGRESPFRDISALMAPEQAPAT